MLQNLFYNDFLLGPVTPLDMTSHSAVIDVNPAIRFCDKGTQLKGFRIFQQLLKIPFSGSPMHACIQSGMHTHTCLSWQWYPNITWCHSWTFFFCFLKLWRSVSMQLCAWSRKQGIFFKTWCGISLTNSLHSEEPAWSTEQAVCGATSKVCLLLLGECISP